MDRWSGGSAGRISGLSLRLCRAAPGGRDPRGADYLALPTVNPTIRAYSHTSTRSAGAVVEPVSDERNRQAFEECPFKYMLKVGLPECHWRFDEPGTERFSPFDDVEQAGVRTRRPGTSLETSSKLSLFQNAKSQERHMTEAMERFAPAWSRLDPQLAAVIRAIFTQWGDKPPVFELTPGEARKAVSQLQIFWSAGAPALPHVEERTIAGASGPIRVRLYDPGVPAPAPAVIFLHGGGWVLCDIDLYDGVARQIATRAGIRCLSVDYGLAPEHPFPVPVHDCVTAVRWAASKGKDFGIDPGRLTLLGDSAGANLALATCLVLRDAGEPLLRAAALIYGVFSDDFATPSQQANGDGSYLLSTAEMRWYWNYYAPEPAARQDPLAAPLRADLRGLPPLYVAAAEYDPLRSDTEELVAKLKGLGAPVEFRLWLRMTHACLNLMGWIDAVRTEVDHIGDFLRQVTDSSGVRRPG